ncbi:MAG: replication factor C large subunit [Candidatus Thorarchaeota archaeon]|nr:MAG: replication factor C large subunit [Candidatus Thorarchaeota archaeon]
MSKESLPWPERYRPISQEQLVGNTDTIHTLREWISSWRRGIPKKRAILLIGPPGVGKTASICALSHDLNMELVEFNASDKRNKGSIETTVWIAATQQTLDGRLRIIMLDEVDGLSGTSDRGGVGAILGVIAESVHPIVMTANDPSSPRLKDLRKNSLVLVFRPLEPSDVMGVLRRIADSQNVIVKDEILEEITDRSAGDLRAAISDLEVILKGGSLLEGELPSRDIKRNVKEALRRLFMTTDSVAARRIVSEADIDYESLLLWLEQNVHLHLRSAKELDLGFEALSLGDLTLGRIMRKQNWKLLSYVYDFLSAGVATSRQESPFRHVDYAEPTWPLLVWQGNRKREKKTQILTKLAKFTGVSVRRGARTHQDTIERIVERDPKMKEAFASWLEIKSVAFGRSRSAR